MKKWLSLLLAAVMVFGISASALAATDPNTLVVGTSEMNGDFIEGFGNSAYDASMKRLLHKFSATVAISPNDELSVNPTVVKDHSITTDEAGNKTYTWTIHDDLKWSNGSPITAKDFVFNLLYFPSPAWGEAGATPLVVGYGLLGYSAYLKGETDVFAGVKLIDDHTFSMTIDAAELPYFYELSYVDVDPDCMAVYAPNMDIVSDENGSKLVAKAVDQATIADERAKLAEEAAAAAAAATPAPEGEEGKTAAPVVLKDANYRALLADLQNVAATERFAPSVACGPYKFVSYENQTVTLEINEHYKGDANGKKPTIPFIVQKAVPQLTNVDQLIAGDLDLVAGVIEGAKIEAARAASNVKLHSYNRNGYGYLGMHCDWGVTADVNVRWALGYLIDRNAVIDYVLGGYGGTVHGHYGFAQWMYQEAGADLEAELTAFNLNLDKANELLDQTEWKYEADGKTPFDAAKANAEGTYMRHDDKGEPMVVRHLGTVDNKVTDIIEIQYAANAPKAGVKFEVTKSDFNALLENFYYGYDKGADRTYNTFNLATTFGRPFDPYDNWHSDYFGTWQNSCQVNDKVLDEAIMGMRRLESTQKDEFIESWLKFEQRWQELLPEIPLYSNEYFDISSTALEGLNTTPFASWEYIVCELSKTAQ